MAEDDENVFQENQLLSLKKVIGRIVKKREEAVLKRLVYAHRDGTLTPEAAYASVMLIAELRFAEGDVGKDDL